MTDAPVLKLLGREDCHLCEVAQRELDRLGVRYEVVDIDDDPELEQRYNEDIPVVLYGETELARAPIEPVALRRTLERLDMPRVNRR